MAHKMLFDDDNDDDVNCIVNDDEKKKKKNRQIVQLPISTNTHDANDTGVPLCISRPATAKEELSAFSILAEQVSTALFKIQHGQRHDDNNENNNNNNDNENDDINDKERYVTFQEGGNDVGQSTGLFDISTAVLSLDRSTTRGNSSSSSSSSSSSASTTSSPSLILRLFSDSGAIQKKVLPAQLRVRDPNTGKIYPNSPFHDDIDDEIDNNNNNNNNDKNNKHPDPIMVTKVRRNATNKSRRRSPSLIPARVERKGHYGFGIEWGDGAMIIYSMRCIVEAAGGSIVLASSPSKEEEKKKKRE